MQKVFTSPLRSDPLAEPLFRQIYLRIKDAITQGSLVAGSRLPSVRGLASDLGVARATVDNAYAQLVAEGFLQSRGQAGTYVSSQLKNVLGRDVSAEIETLPLSSSAPLYPTGAMPPFQLGLPALDAFPRALWQRIVARQLRSTTTAMLAHPPASGLPNLKEAIAHYLLLSRGIRCQPEQVFICAGYQALLTLIISTLLQAGDLVWLEDPGYPVTQPLFHAAGIKTIPVPVDAEGMNIAAAPLTARMAVLTPTHQSPLGVSLSLPRRMALLDWAQQHNGWIVEDDYDSEFRYQGKPLPPLKSLDSQGRVLYAGTFSKALFPALRLAYLVVPVAQVAAFEQSCRLRISGCPPLIQASVAEFIQQGHFYRHLKRMRPLYRERREWLVAALEHHLGDILTVAPQAGGIQLLTRLKPGWQDSELAEKAWQQGLAMQALSHWQTKERTEQGLLMGFANFTHADEAEKAVVKLATAFIYPK